MNNELIQWVNGLTESELEQLRPVYRSEDFSRVVSGLTLLDYRPLIKLLRATAANFVPPLPELTFHSVREIEKVVSAIASRRVTSHGRIVGRHTAQ